MHKRLIMAVLCFCFCSSMAFAASKSMTLDTGTGDTGPISAIVNAINKIDAWIQQNIW
jgi:hypothetical protein